MKKLEELDMSIRALNVLKACNITTVEGLEGITLENLWSFRCMTKRTIEELIDLGLIDVPKILYRKSDGCEFLLGRDGIYTARDEHGVVVLDPKDGVVERP